MSPVKQREVGYPLEQLDLITKGISINHTFNKFNPFVQIKVSIEGSVG